MPRMHAPQRQNKGGIHLIPGILITIAWVLIAVRCGLRFFHLINNRSKDWLEVLFQLSIVIIALAFLL